MAQEAKFTTFYEREYFEMSTFIHSAPASVWWDLDGVNHFQIQRAEHPDLARRAVGLSNLYMWHMVSLVDTRYRLGLSEYLQAIQVLSYQLPPSDREMLEGIFRKIEPPGHPFVVGPFDRRD